MTKQKFIKDYVKLNLKPTITTTPTHSDIVHTAMPPNFPNTSGNVKMQVHLPPSPETLSSMSNLTGMVEKNAISV